MNILTAIERELKLNFVSTLTSTNSRDIYQAVEPFQKKLMCSNDLLSSYAEAKALENLYNSGLVAKDIKEGQLLSHSGDAYNSSYEVAFVYQDGETFEYMDLKTGDTVTLNLEKGKLPYKFRISDNQMNETQKEMFEDLF